MVSVVVPCHNQGCYLADAVNSVIAQTAPDWECLILNDGSTDDTRRIGLDLAGSDRRIRYLEHPNCGLAATRNRGLDEARGRYIQFLDADDSLLPRKFELQTDALAGLAVPALAYCRYVCSRTSPAAAPDSDEYARVRLDEDNPLRDLAESWEHGLSIPVHCFLFDRRIFGTPAAPSVRFDASLPNHEDWDCWMKVFAAAPAIRFVDASLAIYRIRAESMSSDVVRMHGGFQQAIARQLQLLAADPALCAVLRRKARRVRSTYLWLRLYRCAPAFFDLIRRLLGRKLRR